MTTNTRRILLAGALTLPAACSKSADNAAATTKTLDNLTRADRALVANKCGVFLTPASLAKFGAADQTKLSRVRAHSNAAALEATGAFMAVPKPIQSLFFASGGVIRVVSDPTSYCAAKTKSPDQKAFADASNTQLDACWQVAGGQLEVIVRDNEAAVHHAMVRVFGYVYTQYFGDNVLAAMASDAAVKATVTRGALRFKTQRLKLGKALLADLAKSSKPVHDKFLALAKTSANDFGNFAVADAIDSYYCSPETRAVFKADFPATWKVFTEGELALTTDLGEPLAK